MATLANSIGHHLSFSALLNARPLQIAHGNGSCGKVRQQPSVLCKCNDGTEGKFGAAAVGRREAMAIAMLSSVFLLVPVPAPAPALLEADDDEALLEKVKSDRRKRIQKREELSSFKTEAASIQNAIYKLSKAGQALDGNDFPGASSVLGTSLDTSWVADVKSALSKVSSTGEEKSEVESFSSSLEMLQSAVMKQDLDSSKRAFVASASALERWSSLTGFNEELKGL